jgi:hypothetical protein
MAKAVDAKFNIQGWDTCIFGVGGNILWFPTYSQLSGSIPASDQLLSLDEFVEVYMQSTQQGKKPLIEWKQDWDAALTRYYDAQKAQAAQLWSHQQELNYLTRVPPVREKSFKEYMEEELQRPPPPPGQDSHAVQVFKQVLQSAQPPQKPPKPKPKLYIRPAEDPLPAWRLKKTQGWCGDGWYIVGQPTVLELQHSVPRYVFEEGPYDGRELEMLKEHLRYAFPLVTGGRTFILMRIVSAEILPRFD